MSKTEQLNLLFANWEKSRKCDNEKNIAEGMLNKFCSDGIIDEESFRNQEIKVLFISNEANLGKKYDYVNTCNEIYDRRVNFNDYYEKHHDDWRGKLRERVSCLYQVIINDYSTPPYDVANRFAFMNLNKRGGENLCDINHLITYCTAYKQEIQKEIKIIFPDLIIWLGCNSFDEGIPEIIGADKKTFSLNIDGKIISIIRMWHTSYNRSREGRLNKFDNAIVDKLAFKLSQELEKINFR